jgi:hypothetical protein
VCCGEVLDVDIVVCLCREEILVPDDFLGKGNMRKDTAITLNSGWQMDLNDAVWDFSCPAMFLMPPAMMVPSVR